MSYVFTQETTLPYINLSIRQYTTDVDAAYTMVLQKLLKRNRMIEVTNMYSEL